MAERLRPSAEHYKPPIPQAPETAEAIYQGSGDTDLVERGRGPPISQPSRPRFDLLSSGSPAANNYSKDVGKSRSTSWYRTKKGLAIMVVGAFVVVGVILGVAVGVTRSKNNGPANSGPVNEVTTASTTSHATTAATTATTTTTAVITRTATTTTIGTTTSNTSAPDGPAFNINGGPAAGTSSGPEGGAAAGRSSTSGPDDAAGAAAGTSHTSGP